MKHLHRGDGKETEYTQDILYFLNVFLLHRPLGFNFNFTEKKIILTEISHSAKVTKHTKRINNPRKGPEFNPRNIDMISCTCSSHISEASRWIPEAGQPV